MAKIFTITEGLENMGSIRTGGQGSVYKGKRMGPVISAVKLLPTPIHTENTDDKNFRDFQNEVEKLKKVNANPSPNVVKILNSGLTESGSLPFIEMEYIEGPDLEDLLKPPHDPIFTIRETLKLAEQLANALAHCHRVGVKHGDIKSNNIKFNTATGNYILLDFGLAVMSDEQRRSSLRHAGAVEFMAPEQHEGETLFQSDIYSYGIILYELLAGSVPFPLINKSEMSRNIVMLAHIEKQVPDLIKLRDNHLPISWSDEKQYIEMQVPAWLLEIINKCLQKNPHQRFGNGMDLKEAIANGQLNALNKEIITQSDVQATTILSNLQSENEALHRQIARYQRTLKARGMILLVSILISILSTFAITRAFNTNSNSKIKSDTILNKRETPVKQTLKKPATDATLEISTTDTLKTTPVNKNPDPQKNKKTKDGLVNDVPYF